MTTKILVRVILSLQILQIVHKIVEVQLDKREKETALINRLDELSNDVFKLRDPL